MVIKAKIHSKGGELDEVRLEHIDGNKAIAFYKGARYTAIYNVFVGCWYVDDLYGQVTE